ncbi:ribosomal protein S5 domain 2-type protein [Geopyxis carbonaria]|nr:ribosomal protein S5 domain 2-type protein [Geopyxis carbonaria]
MTDPVPTVHSLTSIYPPSALTSQTPRWSHLLTTFSTVYSHPATFIARSPGRVNIIGEHIDYSLFPVLPMAVEADMLLAVRIVPSSSTITLTNVRSQYPTRTFAVPVAGAALEIDATALEWSNYFKAGYRGALEFLGRQGRAPEGALPGLEILVDGSVPSGGGLSSSAAFVCASALATLVSLGVEDVQKTDLVSLAVVAERYVGVNSGGMDQSASVLGQQGRALRISFSPALSATPVRLPASACFLIANSFVVADKYTTGPIHYNLRVVECTLAALVLAAKLNLAPLPADAGPLGCSLHGLQDAYLAAHPDKTGADMAALAAATLDKEGGYTKEEIADIVGMGVEELEERYMRTFPVRASHFQLRDRALHVFAEAARVDAMCALLSSDADDADLLPALGALLRASQDSCRDLYDCSAPELETLCQLAKDAGAYGGRLTGAGWGGCSVHLVPADRVEAVKEAWWSGYYSKRFGREEWDAGVGAKAVVVSRPGSGTVLFRVGESGLEIQ